MHHVVCGSFTALRWPLWSARRVRVVCWNIDRGERLPEIIRFLETCKPDLLMLQEVDVKARRTGFRNVAEEIARRMRMDYAFGHEFQELSQGRHDSPAYHGQATLSVWPLERPRIIRFRHQCGFWKPRWFLPRTKPFQPRRGGRIALVCDANIFGRRLAVYNLHLESRSGDDLRIAQLYEALDDAAHYLDQQPVILGGDMNIDLSRSFFSGAALRRMGFHSAIALPAPRTTTPRGLLRQGRTIDWVYLAGPVDSSSGEVKVVTHASDHYPILFDLNFMALPPSAS